jgi:hypothetical protein
VAANSSTEKIDDSLLTTALFEKNYYGQYKAVVVSNDQYRFATNDIVEQIEILCFRTCATPPTVADLHPEEWGFGSLSPP